MNCSNCQLALRISQRMYREKLTGTTINQLQFREYQFQVQVELVDAVSTRTSKASRISGNYHPSVEHGNELWWEVQQRVKSLQKIIPNPPSHIPQCYSRPPRAFQTPQGVREATVRTTELKWSIPVELTALLTYCSLKVAITKRVASYAKCQGLTR